MAQAGQASGDLGRPVEGVLWMLTTTLAFVGVNGIVRHLGTELPAAQSAAVSASLLAAAQEQQEGESSAH